MAFGRKRSQQKGEGSAAKPAALRVFLPGAALGLLLFVVQGVAFDGGATPLSIGAVMVSRLVADAVIGVVGLCAAYIALYAVRLILGRGWSWLRASLRREVRP